jgi:holin-like protein
MLQGIGILFGLQLVGDIVARILHLSIPGSIFGLLLLFGFLQYRCFTHPKICDDIDTTCVGQVAAPILRNLGILFVAPGVGIVQFFDLLARRGTAVAIVLVASTLLTMAVTMVAFGHSRCWRAGA